MAAHFGEDCAEIGMGGSAVLQRIVILRLQALHCLQIEQRHRQPPTPTITQNHSYFRYRQARFVSTTVSSFSSLAILAFGCLLCSRMRSYRRLSWVVDWVLLGEVMALLVS